MKNKNKKARVLTLCADDFGLTASVNAGIIKLVEEGRLNAVSIMAGSACFEAGYSELLAACKKSPVKVALGLHITLTEYEPLTDMPCFAPGGVFPSVSSLLLKSHLGFLKDTEIEAEIESQIARFQEITGRRPDFFDGHQHVHLFPVIRKKVLKAAKKYLPEEGWIRSCSERNGGLHTLIGRGVKQKILATQSNRFKTCLKKQSVQTNDFFYGVNNFNQSEDYQSLFQGWLKQAEKHDGTILIMCHPAQSVREERDVPDPISKRRLDEFSYFSSSAFDDDLMRAGFTLSKAQD